MNEFTIHVPAGLTDQDVAACISRVLFPREDFEVYSEGDRWHLSGGNNYWADKEDATHWRVSCRPGGFVRHEVPEGLALALPWIICGLGVGWQHRRQVKAAMGEEWKRI